MLFFNNVSIATFPGLLVEDIHVSAIPLNPIVRERPVAFGAEYERMAGGVRTVTVTFAVLTMDRTKRTLLLMDVIKWARSVEVGKLQLSDHPGMYLMATLTEAPSPSTRQWWEDQLKLVFTAFEPFWISDAEKRTACGGLMTISGSAPPQMKIVHTYASQASNQSWSDGENTITLSTVPAGQLTIDLDKQLIDVDGVSVMQYFTFGSRFIKPHINHMTITGPGEVRWRERWE